MEVERQRKLIDAKRKLQSGDWADRDRPTIDADAVEAIGQELTDCLREYQPDFDEPNAEWLGPVLNATWRLDCELNPERLPFGHAHRDDALRASAASQAMLHKWRREADRLIRLFSLETIVGGDDVQAVIREFCERIRENNDGLPRLRDGYSQIHPPSKWFRVFGVDCWRTIKRRIDQGQYDALKIDEKNYRFRIADIPKSKRKEVC